jgi:hypothetical protein
LRIFKNAWFSRFARRENIKDAVLVDAVARAERGVIDADLGGGVIKQRIARPGQVGIPFKAATQSRAKQPGKPE